MIRRTKLAALVVAALLIVGLMVLAALPGRGGATLNTRPTSAPTTTIATSQPVGPYTVTMSPMGDVTFKTVPQRIVTQDANYNDMLSALGVQKRAIASGWANNRFDGYYAELPGTDLTMIPNLGYLSAGGGGTFDKEALYALHAGVFHIDPVMLAHSRGWSEADVQEIARNVGPFFANRYSRTADYKADPNYKFYTVWELAEKMGQVYRRPARITQLKAIYDGMVQQIQAKLPPLANRPRVGLLIASKAGFTIYQMEKGFDTEQYRAVGTVDAFTSVKHLAYGANGGVNNARLDLEGLLSIDPDVLITPFAVMPGMHAQHEQLLKLKDDPLGKRLKAFKANRVYAGGTPLQGPLFLLFQTEMAAKQIYPDLFGTYREDQKYPPAEQLFDRSAVIKILTDVTTDDEQSRAVSARGDRRSRLAQGTNLPTLTSAARDAGFARLGPARPGSALPPRPEGAQR